MAVEYNNDKVISDQKKPNNRIKIRAWLLYLLYISEETNSYNHVNPFVGKGCTNRGTEAL